MDIVLSHQVLDVCADNEFKLPLLSSSLCWCFCSNFPGTNINQLVCVALQGVRSKNKLILRLMEALVYPNPAAYRDKLIRFSSLNHTIYSEVRDRSTFPFYITPIKHWTSGTMSLLSAYLGNWKASTWVVHLHLWVSLCWGPKLSMWQYIWMMGAGWTNWGSCSVCRGFACCKDHARDPRRKLICVRF